MHTMTMLHTFSALPITSCVDETSIRPENPVVQRQVSPFLKCQKEESVSILAKKWQRDCSTATAQGCSTAG